MSAEWISRGRCHVFGSDIVHDNGIMDFKFVLARQTDPEILKPHLFETIDPGAHMPNVEQEQVFSDLVATHIQEHSE